MTKIYPGYHDARARDSLALAQGFAAHIRQLHRVNAPRWTLRNPRRWRARARRRARQLLARMYPPY